MHYHYTGDEDIHPFIGNCLITLDLWWTYNIPVDGGLGADSGRSHGEDESWGGGFVRWEELSSLLPPSAVDDKGLFWKFYTFFAFVFRVLNYCFVFLCVLSILKSYGTMLKDYALSIIYGSERIKMKPS